MKPFVLLNKRQGTTPLFAIDSLRSSYPEYDSVSLGVAGRLDPMAEGLLLVLVGDENKKRKEYEKLSKTYRMDMLFGFETDTYDELGIVSHTSDPSSLSKGIAESTFNQIPDRFDQPYPPYSSKPVNGKPLYYWAREGMLSTITIPSKQVEIFNRTFDEWRTVTKQTLMEHIYTRIRAVSGDFRQEHILQHWKSVLSSSKRDVYPVASVTVTCSSGTYMRGLAHMIGQSLGVDALAYSIQRTHIGPYSLSDVVHTI